MRWFVEISSLGKGKGPTAKLCVEAPQWQPALQKARELRGDQGALSNFSIELLEDGYRAIDPATRLRYIVKKAPDDAALSNGEAAKSVDASKAAASTPSKKKPEQDTVAFGSKGAAGVRPEETRRKSGNIAIPVDQIPPPPRLVQATPPASVPPFKLVSTREEEPSTRSPLTYREAVYAVAPNTPADRAEELIQDRFRDLRGALAHRKSGKLVNLAVFDHAYQGKPQRPPIVTLTWKDWKGDSPEVRFPLRDGPGNTPTPLAPSAAATPPSPPVVAPPTPEPIAAEPIRAETPVPAPRVSSSRPPAPSFDIPPPKVEVTVSVKTEQPPPSSKKGAASSKKATPTPKAAAPVAKVEAPAPAPKTPPPPEDVDIIDTADDKVFEPKPASIPPAPNSHRLAGDDLIAELFEACSDLHFLTNPLEGADFVLTLTLEKLPSQMGMVSLFDMNKREFVVVRQAGGKETTVLARLSERSPLAHTAMRTKHAIVVADVGADPRIQDDPRWGVAGVKPTSVICAPVELAGRYLGLIEIANPLDGDHFTASDGHALTYIGQQYAEFVAQHGFIIDPEVVTQGPKKGRLR